MASTSNHWWRCLYSIWANFDSACWLLHKAKRRVDVSEIQGTFGNWCIASSLGNWRCISRATRYKWAFYLASLIIFLCEDTSPIGEWLAVPREGNAIWFAVSSGLIYFVCLMGSCVIYARSHRTIIDSWFLHCFEDTKANYYSTMPSDLKISKIRVIGN